MVEFSRVQEWANSRNSWKSVVGFGFVVGGQKDRDRDSRQLSLVTTGCVWEPSPSSLVWGDTRGGGPLLVCTSPVHRIPSGGFPILSLPLGASNDVVVRTIALHSAAWRRTNNRNVWKSPHVTLSIYIITWLILFDPVSEVRGRRNTRTYRASLLCLGPSGGDIREARCLSEARCIWAPGETWRIPENATASGRHHWVWWLRGGHREAIKPRT